MGKSVQTQKTQRSQKGKSRKLIVNSNQQLPENRAEEYWADEENVLSVLDESLLAPGRNGSVYQAQNDDVLQLFDAPSVRRPAGKAGGLFSAGPNAETPIAASLNEYQKPQAEVAPARQVAGEYIAPPPTNPSQRNQGRRATAKLDYYKKLAELQQMNLEFGRSIRVARNEARSENNGYANHELINNNAAAPQPEARPQASRREAVHPLTTSFHVATKRGEARHVTAPLPAKQPQPQPVPANQQRVTAKLDYNRLLEFQRRYEEAQPNGPTIEDRLANHLAQQPQGREFARETVRVAEPMRPRLPVREVEARQALPEVQDWHNTPAPEAVVWRQQAEQDLQHRQAQVPAVPPQVGTLRRSSQEQLAAQMRQPVERVREVLLDPTRIDPHLIALSDFNPRAARYFDQVAVSLISVSYKRLCKRVLLASALPGEGRTCVALNLAGALARARQRVLVVDCDLANPSVLRLLGIDAPLGLSEAVHRGLGPNSAALRVQPAAFNILPTREKVQHTAELLASPRFHEMLQLCEPDYDFILFDSSPLLESADANLLAGLTDATMLVIRPGMTTTQQMAKAVSLFNEKDICGVVLNRVAK
jgi:Mrp family chromosome partitioning ATPase